MSEYDVDNGGVIEMSEFTLFIRNQAKEAERKLKVSKARWCACVDFALHCGGGVFTVSNNVVSNVLSQLSILLRRVEVFENMLFMLHVIVLV